jgi:hypothetical protein
LRHCNNGQPVIPAKPDSFSNNACNAALTEKNESLNSTAPAATTPSPLHELLGHIAQQTQQHNDTDVPGYPELSALEDFRQMHSRLRLQGQVRQTMQPAPTDAGPLNSRQTPDRLTPAR